MTATTTAVARTVPRVGELTRKAFAELLGSALLAATVVGSGIAAQRLSPHDTGLELLENAVITGAVLVALILALGPVSAAFNPVVTLAERAFGAITTRAAAVFIAAQVAGCCLGVMVANLMFELPAVNLSQHHRSTGALWLGEVVATFGLLIVIFGVVRSGRTGHVAYAVGGYITAAYWFTSSTSFANPAISIGRTLTNTFAGIAPAYVPMFALVQILGGAPGRRGDRRALPRCHAGRRRPHPPRRRHHRERPVNRPDLQGCQHRPATQPATAPPRACCASNPLPPTPPVEQPRRCGQRTSLKEFRKP